MPPIPTWYRGRDAVAAFLTERVLRSNRPRRLIPIRANGALAFGQYVWDERSDRLQAHGIIVLSLEGDEIIELTAFLSPDAFGRFGLPSELWCGCRTSVE